MVLQQECDFSAISDIGAFARIEIEDDCGGRIDGGRAMKKRVNFQTGQVRAPNQRREVINQEVPDGRSAATPWHGKGPYPFGLERRCILCIKKLAVDTVGIALERDRQVLEMRQDERRDASVIVDNLALCEAGRGI